MWRRELHSVYGEFDSCFEVAGDYEFWLRLAAKERFHHIPEVLGLYLVSPGGMEHRNLQLCAQESELARARHWSERRGHRPVPGGSFLVPINRESHTPGPAEPSADRDQPLVSVVMPTRNRRELIQDALRSVAAQDYTNWEMIIVNDGGEDVADLIQRYLPAKKLRYISMSQGVGQVAARNAALRAARGDIICYLDDDDAYLPCHIGTIVRALQQGEHAFVYTDAEYATEVIENGERLVVRRTTPYAHGAFSLEQLLVQNYIPINTWGHMRDCLWEIGLFDEEMTCLEDWEFLLRLTSQYGAHHVGVTTVEVRVRADLSDSVSSQRRLEFLPTFLSIYRRYEDRGNQKVQTERHQMLRGLAQEAVDNRLISGSPDVVFQAVLKELYASSTNQEDEQPKQGFEGDRSGLDLAYQRWRTARESYRMDGEILAERLLANGEPYPAFHLLVVVSPGHEYQLADTLDSLRGQWYRGWGLTVIANSPVPDPAIEELDMIEWVHVTGKSQEAVRTAIEQSPADWLAVIESGDMLAPETFLSCASYIKANPRWRFIYVDEDLVDADGKASVPSFKPDFNLDLLRSTPYVGNFCLIHREGLRHTESDDCKTGINNYAMVFRVLERWGESAIGHIADVLFHRYQGNEECIDAGRRETRDKEVLVSHLERCGIPATVVEGIVPYSYFVQYEHAAKPLVSIIIPTKDRLDLLKPCVTSLLQKTTYPNYELWIVDNNSVDPDTLCYLESLEVGSARLNVLRYADIYNFSAINNFAASRAKGDYLVLLNNDTQIVQPHWLERMMAHALRPEVGIVGARLVYGDQKIQHAGVVLGMGGVAEHIHIGLSMSDSGYMGRAQLVQNFSAVTAACMVIRKSVYEEIGGLDENDFKVLFNDIDFCLRVGERGYKIVWTPFATLVHHGSSSISTEIVQGQIAKRRGEAFRMFERWLPKLGNDPAYNRNLSLKTRDPVPEAEVVPGWDPVFHDRPRILGFPFDTWGCGEYRVRAPLRGLATQAFAQTALVPQADARRLPEVGELARMGPDTLLLQSFVHDTQLAALEYYARLFPDMFRVFELDDLKTQMPAKNPHQKTMYKDIKKRLRKALSHCNRMIVSTEPLRDAYSKMIDDVVVVPNYLERARWTGLVSERRQGKKPRVGWAGAQQHHGDLEILCDVVRELGDEVEWIFFGMCPKELQPFVSEFYPGVPFDQYPAKLAGLNLDLALAPLEHNKFNEAKSNLRLLEYGIMGWPVVSTDIYPYQNAPVHRVANNPRAWVDAIREHVNDLDAAENEGDRLRRWVMQEWILEDHLECWLKALTPTSIASGKNHQLPQTGTGGRG
jgi:glycosyltransferase involved in cell wall biosynthesis